MERGTKENGKMESFMEKELRHFLMELFLMASGLKEDPSVLGCVSTQMVQSTLETGLMGSLTVKELRYLLMESNTAASG